MAADSYRIQWLSVGKPAETNYQGKMMLTAIGKQTVVGEINLRTLNFEGDAQGDLKHHGGKDKAVCAYPYDHYAYWERTLQKEMPPASFGENLTVCGLVETELCIGDIFELGEAQLQVSQPRQPCFKLAHKHGVPDFVALIRQQGYTGYYFRVLREGRVNPADVLKLVGKDRHGVTVSFANQIMYHDKHNADGLRRLLEVEALSDSWREQLSSRL